VATEAPAALPSGTMTIFDLLFLVAALALVIAVLMAAFNAIRGRGSRAFTIARRIAVAAAVYFAAVAAVSVATPRRIVPLGVAQCFDDWCITATAADRSGDSLRVVLQLSSLARGISQGERDVRVYMVDDGNRRYQPIDDARSIPLSVTIPPAGTVTTTRLFVLPQDARNPVLIVAHDAFPHCCIIGDRESLFHRATVVPLP
jgi:hypothetical protein